MSATNAPGAVSTAPPQKPGDTHTRPSAAKKPRNLKRPLAYVLVSAGLLVMSAPFLWMALSAFKTQTELTASPPVWIPTDWTLENFRNLLDKLDLPLYFMNSVIVAVLVTLSNLVFCSMLGYALAKLKFAGRNKIFGLVLGALMVPGNLMLLPLFVLMSKLHLIDSYSRPGAAVRRRGLRGLPDASVHAVDPGRAAGGGPDGRRR